MSTTNGIWPTTEDTAKVNYVLGTGYNELPKNHEVITESEFFWRWSVMPAKRIYQHRQVKIGAFWQNVSMFVHPGDYSGIGFHIDYNGRATRSEIDAYKPTYFKWVVCDHEFETTTTANCYWEGKCTKCGYVKSVDSSG